MTVRAHAQRIVLLALTILLVTTIVAIHAYSQSKFVYSINVPYTYPPHSEYRNLYIITNATVKIMGNVTGSKPGIYCIDVSKRVKSLPEVREVLRYLREHGIIIGFSVYMCAEASPIKTTLLTRTSSTSLTANSLKVFHNFGGKTVKIITEEGTKTFLKIHVYYASWSFIFMGYTYVTLSEAKTYVGKSGLLKGYVFTTASYPLDILDLVLAIVNEHSVCDFWGLITRSLLTDLVVLDYIVMVGTLGYATKTVSGACLGNICVVCRSSWNLERSILKLAYALTRPGLVIRGLYTNNSECQILNITSRKIIRVNQKANLTIYIQVVYGIWRHSRKISLIIPSCNRYWCIVGFEENYPVKELNLKNVKASALSFYVLIPKGYLTPRPLIRNVTLIAYESSKISYNYTHSIMITPVLKLPEPYIENGKVLDRYVIYLAKLSKVPTVMSKGEELKVYNNTNKFITYYIRNGQNLEVYLPKEINYSETEYLNGLTANVKYHCKLVKVSAGSIKYEDDYAKVLISNVDRDLNITATYVCEYVNPIPYLVKLECPKTFVPGSEFVIILKMLNLGSSGTIPLKIVDNGKSEIYKEDVYIAGHSGKTVNIKITLSGNKVHTIYVMYKSEILGSCTLKPASTATVKFTRITFIPISSTINVKELIKALNEKVKPKLTYIRGEVLRGILVNGDIGSIREIEIVAGEVHVTISTSKNCTQINNNLLLCSLSEGIPLNSKTSIHLIIKAKNGTEYVTQNEVITPVSEGNITVENVLTGWISTNKLLVNISVTNLNYHDVEVTIEGPGIDKTLEVTFNSKGIAVFNVTLSRALRPGDIIRIKLTDIGVSKSIRVVPTVVLCSNNKCRLYVYYNNSMTPISSCLVIAKQGGITYYENCEIANLSKLTNLIILPEKCDNVICLPYRVIVEILQPG